MNTSRTIIRTIDACRLSSRQMSVPVARTLLAAVVLSWLITAPPVLGQDLFVTDAQTGEIFRFNGTNGDFVAKVSVDPDPYLAPYGITTGPDNYLYVVSELRGPGEIKRYDPITLSLIDTFVPMTSNMQGPRGLRFGPDGNLYVGNHLSSDVRRFSGIDGSYLSPPFVTQGGDHVPNFEPGGNLYVSGYWSGSIHVYNPTTGEPITSLSTGFYHDPQGLDLGPDGNLYVALAGAGQIRRFDPMTGEDLGFFAELPGGGRACDLQFGPDGLLYVADQDAISPEGRGRVVRFDPTTGAYLGDFASGSGLASATYFTWAIVPEPSTSSMLIFASWVFLRRSRRS